MWWVFVCVCRKRKIVACTTEENAKGVTELRMNFGSEWKALWPKARGRRDSFDTCGIFCVPASV